jgi:hypothetical protein
VSRIARVSSARAVARAVRGAEGMVLIVAHDESGGNKQEQCS